MGTWGIMGMDKSCCVLETALEGDKLWGGGGERRMQGAGVLSLHSQVMNLLLHCDWTGTCHGGTNGDRGLSPAWG